MPLVLPLPTHSQEWQQRLQVDIDGHRYLKKYRLLRYFVKKSLKNLDYFVTRYLPPQKSIDYFASRYCPLKKSNN